MGQKKLIRFAEIKTFPNVYQYPVNIKGKWKEVFNNNHSITLELACGKGEYAVGMGRLFPQSNFLGVDLKGNRIWVGARSALAEGLHNVAFMRTQIDKITDYFESGEIKDIWITFPDPQLRISRAKKRLTHPRFLRLYQQIISPAGFIHLKTDSPVLYNFTKEVIRLYNLETNADIPDLYAVNPLDPVLQIRTHYEKLDIAQSNRVHYLKFKLPATILPDKDKQLKEIVIERETDRRN
jgi:tRNA (guanine-N7-)-methyltransferase